MYSDFIFLRLILTHSPSRSCSDLRSRPLFFAFLLVVSRYVWPAYITNGGYSPSRSMNATCADYLMNKQTRVARWWAAERVNIHQTTAHDPNVQNTSADSEAIERVDMRTCQHVRIMAVIAKPFGSATWTWSGKCKAFVRWAKQLQAHHCREGGLDIVHRKFEEPYWKTVFRTSLPSLIGWPHPKYTQTSPPNAKWIANSNNSDEVYPSFFLHSVHLPSLAQPVTLRGLPLALPHTRPTCPSRAISSVRFCGTGTLDGPRSTPSVCVNHKASRRARWGGLGLWMEMSGYSDV